MSKTASEVAFEAMALARSLADKLQSEKIKKRFYKAKIKALIASQQLKRISLWQAQEQLCADTYQMLVTKADEKRFKKSVYDQNRRDAGRTVCQSEAVAPVETKKVAKVKETPTLATKTAASSHKTSERTGMPKLEKKKSLTVKAPADTSSQV